MKLIDKILHYLPPRYNFHLFLHRRAVNLPLSYIFTEKKETETIIKFLSYIQSYGLSQEDKIRKDILIKITRYVNKRFFKKISVSGDDTVSLFYENKESLVEILFYYYNSKIEINYACVCLILHGKNNGVLEILGFPEGESYEIY